MALISLSTINVSFIAILLSLSCNHQFAESLVGSLASSTLSPIKHKITTTPSSRVFVGGISHTCTEEIIKATFSKFGAVQNILIVGQDEATEKRKRLPYCFVTFDDIDSAQRAIEAPKPSSTETDADVSLYNEVQYSMPKETRQRSNAARAKELEGRTQIEEFSRETNLILQVQSTHLDRLVEYFHRWNNNNQNNNRSKGDISSDNSCRVVGSANTASRNMSILFLSCVNPSQLSRMLNTDPLLARAINKSYIVQPGLTEGNLATEQGCNNIAKNLFDMSSQNKDVSSIRVQAFPPKHQSRLLQSFDGIINEDDSQQFTISPKGFSHMISVVEVHQYRGRGWEEQQLQEDNRLYMIGISTASLELDVINTKNIIVDDNSGDDVSRAYYKLKEAKETYEASRGSALDQNLYKSIALDCGSAPGGWTKYLIEHFQCPKVYSVDPGSLAPSVAKLDETRHMRMKIQDALPILLQKEEAAAGQVKIWVSDMCLHEMVEQVDQLLLAKEKGLLAPKAFFVLTLKCVMGHSKGAFDSQVEKVVDKLCSTSSVNVVGVETFHLFSNRSGERTVVGYIE
jgi:RNA recognition motif-containing protein/predicted rRNA methylase YqxC with S4 and FtsJ domains